MAEAPDVEYGQRIAALRTRASEDIRELIGACPDQKKLTSRCSFLMGEIKSIAYEVARENGWDSRELNKALHEVALRTFIKC